ncbi:hypothetical protein TNCV_3470921 [Trichonephila clavipes]|nr:hypothetical protein TNCV_3470921 [Trichonephila clavipes]
MFPIPLKRHLKVHHRSYKSPPDDANTRRYQNVLTREQARTSRYGSSVVLARTRDKAIHDPMPIPLGYRDLIGCQEWGLTELEVFEELGIAQSVNSGNDSKMMEISVDVTIQFTLESQHRMK